MDTQKILSIVAGSAVGIAVLAIVVWPRVRQRIVERGGTDATALVKEISLSAVRDEHKQRLYNLTLEVRPPAGPTYDVKVQQLLPWMSGPGMPGHEVPVRVHPKHKRWVAVMPPRAPR